MIILYHTSVIIALPMIGNSIMCSKGITIHEAYVILMFCGLGNVVRMLDFLVMKSCVYCICPTM